MTAAQAEALLDLRAKHLKNLHALYEDRQRLNLQVTGCARGIVCCERSRGTCDECLMFP